MWFQKLNELNDKQMNGSLSYLNLKFELHRAIYTIEALKNRIKFTNSDGKLTIEIIDKNKKKNKKIKEKKFIYWWQIIRYKEIFKEEKECFESYETIKQKMKDLQSEIPKTDTNTPISEENQLKTKELNQKLSSLAEYLNREGPKVKHKLMILSNFRNSYNTSESIQNLLRSIEFYLEFHNSE